MEELNQVPANEQGEPLLSASQTSTFTLCQRKWGFPYLDGIEVPPNASAELGQRVHSVLENWLRAGIAPDLSTEEGRIATSGLSFLPVPGTAEVEQHFMLRTPIAEYQGYKDATWWEERNGKRIRVVCDHKTTGDFQWAKSEEDLKTDIQATLYAAEEMAKHNLDEVELRWIYYRTRGANQAKKVSLVVHRDQIEKNFDVIDATAAVMLQAHRDGKKALDLPPTMTACSAYGGCAHIERCNLQPKDIMRSIMAHTGLAEKLRARNSSVWVPHPDSAGWEWNQATGELRQAAGSAPPPIAGSTGAPTTGGFVSTTGTGVPPLPPGTAAAPPLPPGTALPPVPLPPVVPPIPTNGHGATGILPPEAPNALAPKPVVPVVAAPIAPVVPKAPVAPKAPPVPVAPAVPTYGQSFVAAPSGLTLYVNCVPTKKPAQSLLQFIDPVLKGVCQVSDGTGPVPDYRLIPYGKGAALLSSALRTWLATNKQIGGVSLSTATYEGRDCLSVLSEFADEVITSIDG